MKILYIISHPNVDKSFNHKAAKRAVEMMKSNGHEVRYIDLHAIKFNPIGDENDFVKRRINDRLDYQREQEWANEDGTFSDDIKEQMENVKWCDVMIFQFPLWWWSFPALLKGYFDRVFCKGFLWGKQWNFRGKRALFSVTTGGANSSDEKYESCWTNIYAAMKMLGMQTIHKTYYFKNMNYESYEKKCEMIVEYLDFLKKEVLVEKSPME